MRNLIIASTLGVLLGLSMAPSSLAWTGMVSLGECHSQAPCDKRIDKRMVLAAFIARIKYPRAWTTRKCWHAVKSALVEAGAITSMPTSLYAREAGDELVGKYGFVRLHIQDPYLAPAGSVLVYGNKKLEECHVELRTTNGFASDYSSEWRCKYNLLGVYAKFVR